jgi:predicted amidohydrolase
MKIGILQFSPKLNNTEANIRKIERMLEKSPPADLWVLPELANSGYAFESRDEAVLASETLHDSAFVRFLTSYSQKTGSWFVAGINERSGDKLYNSSVLVSADGVVGVYRKLHLFRNEKTIFEPGNLGLPVFETPWGKIGMLICFDWMFPEAWRIMALKGVQMICHPSNLVLPYCQDAVPGYALTNRIFIATANRIGKERGITFTGRSVLVNPVGKVLLKGKKQEKGTLIAKVNLSDASDKTITPENDAFADRRSDVFEIKSL